MALYRDFELTVGPGSGVDLVTGSQATVISGLDVSFNIKRSQRPVDNKGKFKIYNATADTRQKVLRRGNNLIASAGYKDEGNKGIIFMGSIETVHSYYSGVDWVSEVTAISYKGADKDTASKTLSLGYAKGTPLSTVVSELATAMGLSSLGLENLTGITLPNGLYIVNTAKILMEYLSDIAFVEGVTLTVDQTSLYAYFVGIPSKVSVVIVDYNSSLLKIGESTKNNQWVSLLRGPTNPKKNLVLTTLMDPKIEPLASVVLNVDPYGGTYMVNEVNYYGDNFGGDFNCKVKVAGID